MGLATWMKTVGPGALGLRRGCISISRGRRLPLRRLQLAQAATMFSQTDFPPRLLGITWSTVSPELREPQYWQVQASLASTARRVILRLWAWRGIAHVAEQADHVRPFERHELGVDRPLAPLQQLGLFLQQKHSSSPQRAHVDRLISRVEHKNPCHLGRQFYARASYPTG